MTILVPYRPNFTMHYIYVTLTSTYVVDEGKEVKIVDGFTGRIMEGHRYSDGLHQAIEAKRRRRS